MSRASKRMLKQLLAAALGGIAGAMATQGLERVGLHSQVAAAGMSMVGAAGAVLTEGLLQNVAAGAAAFGASQLVLSWFVALDKRIKQGKKQTSGNSQGPLPSQRNAAVASWFSDAAASRALIDRSEPVTEAPPPNDEVLCAA